MCVCVCEQLLKVLFTRLAAKAHSVLDQVTHQKNKIKCYFLVQLDIVLSLSEAHFHCLSLYDIYIISSSSY